MLITTPSQIIMPSLTTEQCVKQCADASLSFVCANITHSNKTQTKGMFEVAPFTQEWVELEIIPNQLIVGIFFFAWNAMVFPACLGMLSQFITAVKRGWRERETVRMGTVCSFFFGFAFMTPFYGSGLIMPLFAGPLSLGLAYISILAAIFWQLSTLRDPVGVNNNIASVTRRARGLDRNHNRSLMEMVPTEPVDNAESDEIEIGIVIEGGDCFSSDEYSRLLSSLRRAKTSKGIEDGLDELREYVLRHMQIFRRDVSTIANLLRQDTHTGITGTALIPNLGTHVQIENYPNSLSSSASASNPMWTEGVKGKYLAFMRCVNLANASIVN